MAFARKIAVKFRTKPLSSNTQTKMMKKITGPLYFIGLALAWGSSYSWIKIALREIPTTQIIAMRVLVAAVILASLALTKKRTMDEILKTDSATWAKLFILASLSIVVPFLLLSWGVSQISSALSGVLNGTVPLFTVLVAHFTLADERITTAKLLGLIFGFTGSVLLVKSGQNTAQSLALGGDHPTHPTLGALAVLLASLCYSSGAIFARKYLDKMGSLHKAATVTVIAAACLCIVHIGRLLVLGETFIWPKQPLTWAAVVWMGVIGSSFAYIAYFWLITHWGATRVAFVMYLAPVVAIAIGVLFLSEPVGPYLIIGTMFIFAGVAVANASKYFNLLKAFKIRKQYYE
jgi:drug/metabolite transporter (DMT)-like permease